MRIRIYAQNLIVRQSNVSFSEWISSKRLAEIQFYCSIHNPPVPTRPNIKIFVKNLFVLLKFLSRLLFFHFENWRHLLRGNYQHIQENSKITNSDKIIHIFFYFYLKDLNQFQATYSNNEICHKKIWKFILPNQQNWEKSAGSNWRS